MVDFYNDIDSIFFSIVIVLNEVIEKYINFNVFFVYS